MSNKGKEIWRDILNHEGYYQVSNLGNVRGIKRTIRRSDGVDYTYKKRIRKPHKHISGYLMVTLRAVSGIIKTYKVHQLVAIAFLGYVQDGYKTHIVNHIDNVKENNKLSNLELVTPRYNTSCHKKNGTSKYTGVSYHSGDKKWLSSIQISGVNISLGRHDNEIDGYKTYQKALKNKDLFKGDITEFRLKMGIKNVRVPTSKHVGIYQLSKNKKWVAVVKISRKTKHVGFFKTEQEAYEARQKYIKDNNLKL